MKFDLTVLREIVGNDGDLANELFHLFCTTAERCIAAAQDSTTEEAHSLWRDTLHEFRGAAVNVGAFGLADALQSAEKLTANDQKEKVEALSTLKSAYAETVIYLKSAKFE